jgi:hypothetical protein
MEFLGFEIWKHMMQAYPPVTRGKEARTTRMEATRLIIDIATLQKLVRDSKKTKNCVIMCAVFVVSWTSYSQLL